MDKKQLLLVLCTKLLDQRKAAQNIIDNIDNLTNDDVEFLLGRIQWAVTQVKYGDGVHSVNHMSDILQDLKSQELEISLKENNKIQALLDQIDC